MRLIKEKPGASPTRLNAVRSCENTHERKKFNPCWHRHVSRCAAPGISCQSLLLTCLAVSQAKPDGDGYFPGCTKLLKDFLVFCMIDDTLTLVSAL
jgi:hypothetical protein